MRIAFFVNPLGGSPLIGGLMRGLSELGHEVSEYVGGVGYDLIVVCNQVAHTQGYEYPAFPDGSTPICFVDSAEYGYFKRLPGVVNDYWNAFAPGSIGHDTKNAVQQFRLRGFLEGRSFPYFLREYSKHIDFPEGYHPIDYPLYHLSHCPSSPNREQYLGRSLDLYLAWGASHPWRVDITRDLRGNAKCKMQNAKCKIYVIEEDGPRLSQVEYFQGMYGARCTVSFDGYGSGSFRMMEALVRTVLVQGPTSIRFRAPLTDGVNCVEYSVESEGEEFLGTNVCEKVLEVVMDPERAFGIYEAGYHHAMTHYTEKSTASYLLSVVESHDWNKPTII